jgi:hypothetical protein
MVCNTVKQACRHVESSATIQKRTKARKRLNSASSAKALVYHAFNIKWKHILAKKDRTWACPTRSNQKGKPCQAEDSQTMMQSLWCSCASQNQSYHHRWVWSRWAFLHPIAWSAAHIVHAVQHHPSYWQRGSSGASHRSWKLGPHTPAPEWST